jgi:hypothetical protein
MLDVPNFFWDAEPTLHPLYQAVREYLEIKPRIQVLNERCRVFLDLAEILSDAIADKKMTRKLALGNYAAADELTWTDITWIIIVLIIISIFVTCSEVFLRFGLLTSSKHKPTPDFSTSHDQGGVIPSVPLSSRSFARLGLVASWALVGASIL